MAKVIEAKTPEIEWATMSWRALLNIFLVGLVVGLVTYALYVLLKQFVFEPILCRDAVALVRCGTESVFASSIAIVLGSALGLVFLVRERAFRPLLIVLAVALALWGVFSLIATLPWVVAVVVSGLTFGIAYAAFTWLSQPASLVYSLIFVTILVVVTRLMLTI